jgi:hypothetical protein
MEPMTLLILLLVLVIGVVVIAFKRTSKRDPLDDHPMRGTTRRGGTK